MNHRKTIFIGILVFLFQFFLSEYLVIKSIRPDFLLIYILYVAMEKGRTAGVLYGFIFGLLEDLTGVGSLFGLAPFTKSITGFLVGSLKGKYSKVNPIVFHFLWSTMILIHFIIYIYIRFQTVYESSKLIFWETWFFSVIYTFIFIAIFQVIRPIHRFQ